MSLVVAKVPVLFGIVIVLSAVGFVIVKVVSYSSLNSIIFPPDLDLRHPDHTIIATALAVQSSSDSRKTIMVSRDINMRVICDSIGIQAQDYISERAVNLLFATSIDADDTPIFCLVPPNGTSAKCILFCLIL